MKHLKKGRKLKRERDPRRALFRTLLGSLILKEKIKTTQAKAKEIKMMIDKIVNKGKEAQIPEKKVSALRYLNARLPEVAVKKISGEFVKKFESRISGYTRIIKLGARKSDSAQMAIIEFVE